MPFRYKGLTFSDAAGPFVRHMAGLNDHRETLNALQASWDTLSLLGHLSSLKADMGETRRAFDALTGELMAVLADETLARAISGLGYCAQVAIDILTRNLFERTADIGFLAMDDAVVAAAAAGAGDTLAASSGGDALAALRDRFRTYAQRYTVYRDIVLMAPDGRVLARMADGFDGRSNAPLVAAALSARGGFVETYAETDFCGGRALSYASAVMQSQRCLGVLALVFDLDDEAQRVFARLAGDDELMAFVDRDGRIVASNDALRLPRGGVAPAVDAHHRVRLGGQAYVAVRREPQPYQGYAGPGWSALALLPAELAFEHAADRDAPVAFSGEGFFSDALLAVPREAAAIQDKLDRVVWNGQLQRADDTARGTAAFSRALLQEIAATGRRTKSVFEAATQELLDTVTATALDEARFLSGLAVEILDRNLYERACDCRWWAENATLAALKPETAAPVLAQINALYTVYTDILLFDAGGSVLASSQSPDLRGQTLTEPWVAACLGQRDAMGYAVSRFAPTPLYGNRATYVYAAALRDAQQRVIGGVGLVFDAAPQFEAMLAAALPARRGCVGAFVRADGGVIASTGALPFAPPPEVLGLAAGASWNGIVERDGACHAIGATAGSGYREFKTRDGYDETVIALIVVPCGRAAEAAPAPRPALLPVATAEAVEVASFSIGGQWIGLPAAEVLACIDVRQAVRRPAAPASGAALGGYTPWQGGALPLVDLGAAFGQAGAPHRHAIVLAHRGLSFGLLVSDLGPIEALQVGPSPTAALRHAGTELVTQIARSGSDLLPMLTAARIAAVSVALGTAEPAAVSAGALAVAPARRVATVG